MRQHSPAQRLRRKQKQGCRYGADDTAQGGENDDEKEQGHEGSSASRSSATGQKSLVVNRISLAWQSRRAALHPPQALRLEPHQRRHPPRLPVPAIRKESCGIAIAAAIAAIDLEDSDVGEFAACERIQIGLPAASRIGDER